MDKTTENQMFSRRKRRIRIRIAAGLLAVFVIISVFYGLRQSGSALTKEDSVLACAFEAKEGDGYAGYAVHTHNADCYDKNGALLCPLSEIPFHIHSADCYEQKQVLICELPENDGHVHDEFCYECVRGDLTCEEEEGQEHVHSDDCYEWRDELRCGREEGEGAHHHTDECYETQERLICSKLEITHEMLHTHTEDCFGENGELICGKIEIEEHVHGPECFVSSVSEENESEENTDSQISSSPQVISEPEEDKSEESTDSSSSAQEITEQKENKDEPSNGENPNGEESIPEPLNSESENSDEGDQTSDGSEAPEEIQTGYPAQQFRAQAGSVIIFVEAPQGAFPEGTQMSVSPINDETTLNAAAGSVEGTVSAVTAVDITFRNAEGEEIEPLVPILVSMTQTQTGENGSVAVVHIDDEGKASVIEQQETDNEEILFEADEFSVYALVSIALEDTILASDGQNYQIRVTCPSESLIPQDARLSVQELVSADEYLEKAQTVLEDRVVSFARFFDITILSGEEEIQPAAPVQVEITLADLSGETTNAVHFSDEDEPQILEASAAGETVRFEAEGFSVYGIVVTEPFPTASEITQLDGRRFYLSIDNDQGRYYFKNTISNSKIEKTNVSEISSAALYTFSAVEGTSNQFTVSTVNNSNETVYLSQNDSGYFSFVSDPQAQNTVFYVETHEEPEPGAFLIYHRKQNGQKVTWWYNSNGFSGSVQSPKAGNRVVLTADLGSDPLSLDGKSYGIINSQGTVSGYALMAAATNDTNTQLRSKDTTVRIEPVSRTENVFVAKNATIDFWSFAYISGDQYYVTAQVSGENRYLRIAPEGVSLVPEADEYCRISIEPGTGTYTGKYKFSCAGKALARNGNSAFNVIADLTNNAKNANVWMNLAERSNLNDEDFVVYTARKVSVSGTQYDENGKIIYDVEDGDQVIIYTRVWNDDTKCYDFYAIDYDGMLVKAYASGDEISWVGSRVNTMLWDFTEYHGDDGLPNFYYELQNAYSGKYIAPQISGEEFLSDSTIGVNLNGRRNEEYYTTILAWDDPYYDYASLMVRNWKLISAPMVHADTFYFAVMSEKEEQGGEPTPVATIDHTAFGITIKMQDYGRAATVNNEYRSGEMNDVLGATKYNQWTGTKNLLKKNINPETQYPDTNTAVTGTASQHSLGELFSSSIEVNQNFLLSTYNETGYFEYDSTQNFAHLITETSDYWYGKTAPNGHTYTIGDFVVYDELATSNEGNKDTLKHGQFFPYNDLIKYKSDGTWQTDAQGNPVYLNYSSKYSNQMDIHANPLSSLDPRKDEKLYEIPYSAGKTAPQYVDHFFGMDMSASFMQSESGKDDWGHDLIFEFSGDDDFWFYLDGKLILDIGGIHSALDGSINFRTGKVVVNGTVTNLRNLYREAYLEEHPDAGDDEINDWLDGYFTENEDGVKTIYKDYSGHTMRMYYLERGAGASNIHMRFNLAPYKNGEVQLEKKVTGVEKVDPSMRFAYQIYLKDPIRPDGNYSLVGSEGYEYAVKDSVTGEPLEYRAQYETGGISYDHVFFLAPGQMALIELPSEDSVYYLKECGVDTGVFDFVKVNDTELEGTATENENRRDYPIDSATVAQRKKVIYENHVNPDVERSLLITKKLWQDFEKVNPIPNSEDPAVFRFRILIGTDSSGEYMVYNTGKYYVKDPEGYYCIHEDGGFRRAPSETKIFSELSDVVPAGEWKSERDRATFYTSPGGIADRIPVDYSVEVPNLMAGMPFMVEERESEIPSGYNRIDYEREGGVPEGELPNAGVITSARDEEVIVNNQHGYGISVQKKWSDAAFMEDHDEIYFALYLGDELLENSIRQLGRTETEIRWFLPQLAEGKTLNDYLVYELMLTFPDGVDPVIDPETGAVSGYAELTKLEAGDTLLAGGNGNEHGYSANLEYTVAYERVFLTSDEIAAKVNSRSDTVSNTRPGIRIVKTDYTGETALSGAKFRFEKESGEGSGKNFISDEDGLVVVAYLTAGENYVLTETAAPYRYKALFDSITLSVDADWKVSVNGSMENGDFYSITQVENPTAEQMPTVTIKNKPFTLKAFKRDLLSGNAIPGVKFALYREVTEYETGSPMPDYVPFEGFEELVSGEDGAIEKITLDDLRAGVYYLRETETPVQYMALAYDLRLNISSTGEITVQKALYSTQQKKWVFSAVDSSVQLSEDAGGNLILTIYNTPTKSIRILKKSYDSSAPLAGASFELYKLTQLDENFLPKEGETALDSWLTDETGLHEIGALSSNNIAYYLFETSAPDGYLPLSGPVILTQLENGTVTAYLNSTPVESETRTENGVEILELTLYNSSGVVLPLTGGAGTTALYMIGISFIVLAAAVWMIHRIRRCRAE